MKSDIRRRRIISALQTGFGGGGGSPVPDTPETVFGDDLVFWLNPNNTRTLFTKVDIGGSDIPFNQCDTDGDLLGLAYLMGENALVLQSPSLTRQPVYSSAGGRNGVKTDGGDDYFEIPNSNSIISPCHKVQPVWSWLGWIKKDGGDGSAKIIANSTNGTTGPGLQLNLNTSNQLVFRISSGTAANPIASVVLTTLVLDVADGWSSLIIILDGSTVGRARLNGVEETFAVSTVFGTNANALNNLRFGNRQTLQAGEYWNGVYGDHVLVKRAVTSEEISWWENDFNLARYSEDFQIPVFEFSPESGYVFSDDAGTVPAVDSGPVGAVRSKVANGNFGVYATKIFNQTGANKTTWVENDPGINNKPSVNWYGEDVPFPGNNQNLNIGAQALGVPCQYFTEFFVVRQDRTDVAGVPSGGHPFAVSGTFYMVITSTTYPDGPYGVAHVVNPISGLGITIKNKQQSDYNIFAYQVDAPNRKVYSWDGDGNLHEQDMAEGVALNGTWTDMGETFKLYNPPTDPNQWWWHGRQAYYMRVYGGSHSQIVARIAQLRSQFGL